MERNTNEPARRDAKKFLKIILIALTIIIVVLLVAVIVVGINNQNQGQGQSQNQSQSDGTEVTEDEYAKECEDENCGDSKNYEEYSEEIGDEIAGSEDLTMEEVTEIYDKYMSGINNDETLARLKIDCAKLVMLYDVGRENGDEVINNLLDADLILKNIESGGAVLDAAIYYERAELRDEYYAIVDQRQEQDGIDIEMEVEG